MADEPKPPKPAGKSSGGLRLVIVVLVLILLSAGGGIAFHKFVLGPKLEGKPRSSDAIPAEAVAMDFEEAQAAVQPTDPNAATAVLLYTVSMVCANAETKEFITKNKQWFVAMLADLHRNRTRDELNDAAVQKSILDKAREDANSLLRRLQQEENPHIKVLQVLYLKFAMFNI